MKIFSERYDSRNARMIIIIYQFTNGEGFSATRKKLTLSPLRTITVACYSFYFDQITGIGNKMSV